MTESQFAREWQVTNAPHGHVLTNSGVWSPDSRWIVYDTRSDPAGATFDGGRIEQVNVQTGEVYLLYRAKDGAHCGVATYNPVDAQVVFIRGPERPTSDWEYCAWHRQGMLVDVSRPRVAVNLDARELVSLRPGALRGGSHLHMFCPDGQLVAFTYEDHLLATLDSKNVDCDLNQRNVGLSILDRPVAVSYEHPRNQHGEAFSVLLTHTVPRPQPGSDQIQRACEEAWVGTHGYLRSDGVRQTRALAFQGTVIDGDGEESREVFVVDLPDDLTAAGDGPLEGTPTQLPRPPRGTVQRRLTFTADRRFPGLQGPRHWLRSSPDGSLIACLMRDTRGVVQLWTVPTAGGPLTQITHNMWDIGSAFTWSSDGRYLAHAMDNSVFVTDIQSGLSHRVTMRASNTSAPRPEACVFSPDGRQIAYVRPVVSASGTWNQIFVVRCDLPA